MNDLILEAHEDDEEIDLSKRIDDPMLARLLLIELARNERKVQTLRATKASIQGVYDQRIQALEQRERDVRRSLAIYVERNGTASFPDVGSVAARHTKPDVKIQGDEAFAGWLISTGNEAHLSVDQKYTFKPGARRVAREWLHEHGEAPRGCDIVPEATTIVIRKAE